ncbi:MAG: DUF302 domain-containing protein [Leptospirales bacterium]
MYALIAKPKGTFSEVVEKATTALANEGFGILTQIDVKQTMKKKLDLDKNPYLILGACNPELANRAMDAEPDIGVLLPCNVVVREEDSGEVVVSIMNPKAAMQMTDNEEVSKVANEAWVKLERIQKALNENV